MVHGASKAWSRCGRWYNGKTIVWIVNVGCGAWGGIF